LALKRRKPLLQDHNVDSAPCVIRQAPVRCAGRKEPPDAPDALEECRVIEPVRKLTALGLSAKEIEHLDIEQPLLQAICEYARLDHDGIDADGRAAGAIDATLRTIEDQIRDLDLEIQMLNLRKRALRKRTKVLRKLGTLLADRDCIMPAS